MSKFNQKNVVITGGSTGIGLAIAKVFAQLGSNLFLIARDDAKLQEAKSELLQQFGSVKVEVFPVDVADASAVKQVMDTIGGKFGGIQALVNNAGMLRCGRFMDQTEEDIHRTMDVNYMGAVNCVRAAWPYLEQSGGNIGIVSSVAGYVGLIGYGSYSPSKFALVGLAEVLRMEAGDKGIKVTIVYPPDTETPQLEYERLHTLPENRALSANAKVMKPEQVAAKLVNGMEKGKFDVLCNGESRLIRVLRAVWPGMFFSSVDGIVAKSRKGK